MQSGKWRLVDRNHTTFYFKQQAAGHPATRRGNQSWRLHNSQGGKAQNHSHTTTGIGIIWFTLTPMQCKTMYVDGVVDALIATQWGGKCPGLPKMRIGGTAST